MTKKSEKVENNDNVKAEKHEFNADVSKVLRLVIHSIYTNKDILFLKRIFFATICTFDNIYIYILCKMRRKKM